MHPYRFRADVVPRKNNCGFGGMNERSNLQSSKHTHTYRDEISPRAKSQE